MTSSVQRTVLTAQVAGATLATLLLSVGPALCAEQVPVPAATREDDNTAGMQPAGGSTSNSGAGLDEIIVTAQKRSERALDVPATLTVISGDDLARGGAVTNLGLTYHVPGLKMDRVGVNTTPALRGVTSLVVGPGLDPNVATYIDGVYVSDPATILDLPDAVDVEVLKGPQGTLFGRNATGGAIQITTAQPTFRLTGNASASYGNFNDQAFKGSLSGPLIAEKLAASIAVYEETNDGYLRDIISGKRTGRLEAQLARVKLLFMPTDEMEFTLAAYYTHHSDPAGAYATPINGDSAAQAQPGAIIPTRPFDVASNKPATDTSNGKGVSFKGVIQTEPGTLTIIGDWDKHVTQELNPGYAAYAPAGGYFFYDRQPDEKESFEADFASKPYGGLNYIAGVYYYHDVGAYDPTIISSDVPAFSVSIFGFQKSDSYAGFGELNYQITDKLTAIGGVRYSWEERSVDGIGSFGTFYDPPSPKLDYGSATFSAWTPRFSLRYALTNNTTAYFTYSQGFKSGGYDPSAVFGNLPPLTPVKPEKLNAYEVGIKSSPTHGTNIAASVFYYKYSNQQVTAFIGRNGVTVPDTTNAARSTIYGADIEGSAQITDELSFNTGISILHARFDEFPNAVDVVPNLKDVTGTGVFVPVGNISENVDAGGRALPRSPDWTVSFGGAYAKGFKAGTLTLKADVFRSAKFFFDAPNRYEQAAYTNLDASLSWQLLSAALTFTLWGRNLTDTAVPLGSFLPPTASAYNWAPPRTYGVAVATKF